MRTRVALAAVAACLLAVALAACGSSKKSSTASSSSSTPSSSSTTSSTSSNTAASTGGIKVKPETIGIVNLVRQSPAEDKIDQLYTKAGKALGWNVKIVDGAGDPTKIATAAQNFVNQGVGALITTSTESALLRGALRAAKAKGIPTISTNGGTLPSPLFTAKYEEDETKMGQQIADQMKKDQASGGKVANLKTNLASSGVARDKAIHGVLGSSFVAEQNVDLSNPVVNTQKTLTDMLTAHPDITQVHAVYDNMAQAAITTLKSKNSKAKLYTYFTTPTNVQNLRGNTALQALSDVDLPKTGAVAFDQLVNHFMKGTAIDPNALQTDQLTYNVVTKQNVNQLLGSRAEQYSVDSILAPFLKKWSQAYPG
jgi:ABC-type sugar transport system substrate-binding protein